VTYAFAAGDRVRVTERSATGHTRTPRYVKGKCGVVERVCGAFRNPEELAYGRTDGPCIPLYRVRFSLSGVWRSDAARPGAAVAADTVDVELYEHWLERDGTS
jgi:nitrile hydratase